MVELMVSMGITVIFMVGMTAFFSTTFRNMFDAREKVTNTQGQFVVSTIMDGKFVNVESLDPNSGCGNDCVVLRNDMDSGDLPFTYIGTQANGRFDQIVFKDFFVFNGKQATVSSQSAVGIENPGGLTELNGEYYLTVPLEDKVYRCIPGAGPLSACADMAIAGLDQPTGITNNGVASPNDVLYVTDAGSNKIITITDPTRNKIMGEVTTEITSSLNYPTGIEFYMAPDASEYLFVADTYNHMIKKVRITDGDDEVVAGDGDNEDCNNTASFCKLSFPTGLMINGGDLYIADTGSGRVLKMSDPGQPASEGAFERISFTFGGEYAVEKIGFEDFGSELFVASSMDDGLNGTYDNGTHEMNVNSLFTAYDSPGAPCNWSLGGTNLYIDNAVLDISAVEAGDIISVEGNIYEILSKTPSRAVCQDGAPPAIVDSAHILGVDSNLVGVTNGSDIYFGSIDRNVETLDLEFAPGSFSATGFQAIDIDVYEFGNAVAVESHEHFVRVGDGELGTTEDTIEEIEIGHAFPTGLGWSGGLQVSDFADYSTDFSNPGYDYTSDFDVDNFEFDEPNPGEILELNFEAELSKDDNGDPVWEEFTLNSDI